MLGSSLRSNFNAGCARQAAGLESEGPWLLRDVGVEETTTLKNEATDRTRMQQKKEREKAERDDNELKKVKTRLEGQASAED